jgi:GAF domain
VFSDGLEKMDAALSALDRARDIELTARDAVVQEHRRAQLMAILAAAATACLVIAMLAPVRRAADAGADQKAVSITSAPAAESSLSLQPIAKAEPPRAVQAATLAPPPAVTPPPSVDLSAIAALCTDLACVIDTRALPSALERAASVLDASGIVVWIADPDGRELAPILAHGYPQQLVMRMGTIERDAQNVTAAAFRTGMVQTLPSDAVSHGAIAAPLLTAAGPVGVMAAEVLNDREREETTRAVAAIVAAQLATLMGPPSSRARKAEVAG